MNELVRGPRTLLRRRAAAAGLASAIALLSACTGGTSEGTESTDAADKAGVVTDAMRPVTSVDMPTKPYTPPADKHILIMPCGSAGQGCINEANEAKDVAESLGWTVDLIDGKLDPTTWNQVVKQAADSGVDGIMAVSADPNLYTEAMAAVSAKNIPFVLTEQPPAEGDVAGISAYVAPDPVPGGEDVAEWIKADSGGEGHVLVLDFPGFAALQTRSATIVKTLEDKCPDCATYKVDVSVQTMSTSLTPLVTSQLQQHPDIDYIYGSDDCCVSFVQQGIQVAGKSSAVKLMSMTGYPDQMKQLKTGEMSAELASATPFSAWLAIDSLGRLMAGEPLEKNFWATPQRIFSAENISDAPDSVFQVGWDTDTDYQSEFKKLWGVQ